MDEHDSDKRLIDVWPLYSSSERRERFNALGRVDAEDLFLDLPTTSQFELLTGMSAHQRRSWLRLLPPDDAADLIQQFDLPDRDGLLSLLDEATRQEVIALLLYAEDEAGGLMNTRFIRLRKDVPADAALRYFRMQSRQQVEFVEYAYVLGADETLLGIVSLRNLLLADPRAMVGDLMDPNVDSIPEEMDQEEVSQRFVQLGVKAIPVVDEHRRMKGVVTADDIVEVVREEAAEDIQKWGGSEVLDEPYLHISLAKMVHKRAGWLIILFLSEMLTATAMSYFEHEIERAIVLALFIPLIISSGGNSGSQAASLVIRSLALRELRPGDWFRVIRRELVTGIALGVILGSIGFMRILLWPTRATLYGQHYLLIGCTVAISLVGVVLWGSLAGSILPLLLKRLGFDPATASAPFVATLVDVTGIIIYFSVASTILHGTLL